MAEIKVKDIFKGLKNVFILILAVLCFYQTVRLWFDDYSSRNFFNIFNVFFKNESKDIKDVIETLVKPKKMIVSAVSGEGKIFYVKYSDIVSTDEYNAAYETLYSLFENGKFVETQNEYIDWEKLLDKDVVVFDYACSIPSDAFSSVFKANSSLVHSEIKSFDWIFFIPDKENMVAEIVFADSMSEMESICFFTVPLNDNIWEAVEFKERENSLHYVFSKFAAGGTLFSENFFTLELNAVMDYRGIRTFDTYEGTFLSLKNVEEKINGFFENPSLIRSGIYSGEYVYSDDNTVVKYLSGLYLEYSNWDSNRGHFTGDFVSSYVAAVNFIMRDTEVINEYYLSGYKYDGNKWIFKFNYTINDLPVTLTYNLYRKLDMDSFIEVHVSRDRVSKYKKYAQILENNSNPVVKALAGYRAFEELARPYGFIIKNKEGLIDIPGLDIVYRIDDLRSPEFSWQVPSENTFTLPIRD